MLDQTPNPRPRAVETYGGAVPKLPGVKAIMENAEPQWCGVLLEGWKLIFEGQKEELYRLPDDPGELNDLSGGRRDKVRELRAVFSEWEAATARAAQTGEVLREEDIRALESLGYID